ncbi:keratin, type I cytoskeletal 47 kDa-like [Discoglossus pictus]
MVGTGVQTALSFFGCSGAVRMSSTSISMPSCGAGFSDLSGLGYNGKETMQNLNDRLAVYLERVRSLEQTNDELEMKIKTFYDKKATIGSKDFSGCFDTIDKLLSQIHDANMINARLFLEIANGKLVSDDFRMNFESELAIRLGVDNDITGLQRALDELIINRSDLELEMEGLNEELIFLKKNHEEELAAHKHQVGVNVNVELDSAPAIDLSKILAEVREQYDHMIEKNLQAVEAWHRGQCEPRNKEVTTNPQAIQITKPEVIDLKRTVQSMEFELQSLLSIKQALQNTLSETEARYRNQLAQLQVILSQIESDLQQVRSNSELHSLEYKRLMDAKTRLKMEITTYRRLLDGEDNRYTTTEETQKAVAINNNTPTKIVKVKTIIKEMVDGKLVSSKYEESVEES